MIIRIKNFAPPCQAGFTLLEVMIATVLLAVMMTLLLGGMRIGEDSWEKGERIAEQSARMLVADNFFRSHLTDVKPLFETIIDPMRAGQPPHLLFRGNSGQLEYVGTLPPQVKGGMYKFRLHWATENDRSDLKLAIRPFSPAEEKAETDPIEDVLVLENVKTLNFSYLKKDLVSGKIEWLSDWGENFMPSLIRIEISLEGEHDWPAILIAPKVETGQ